MAEIWRGSSRGKVKFTLMLAEKLVAVEHRHTLAGYIFYVPDSLTTAMKCVRRMFARYQRGDYRHTDGEARAEHDLAAWCLNANRALDGLPALTEMPFGDFCSRAEIAVPAFDPRTQSLE